MVAPSLTVAPVQSAADAQVASDILIEAAKWLASRNQSLWDRESLRPERIQDITGNTTIYLARLDGQPIGTFLLLREDPDYWPEAPPGEAFYLHKLAVRRAVAGSGVAREILESAINITHAAGRSLLRLDCAPRPQLCAFYESASFTYLSDQMVGEFTVRRYQRSAIRV